MTRHVIPALRMECICKGPWGTMLQEEPQKGRHFG
jgi:hypothetical protein